MTVALITGCSTGIGYATARRLAQDGHHVVATMRDPSGCDLLDKVGPGETIELRQLDVTAEGAVEALVAELEAKHGGVDILVNNAGVGGYTRSVEELPLDGFRQVMETNFFGAIRCTQAVLPGMRERGSGCIVNVTSIAGRVANPCMADYAASKFALEAASDALAAEVAPFGIRVAVIEPGVIMTAIWSKADLTPPTGPYAPKLNRLTQTVLNEMPQASKAREVADCISEAIHTTEPRLRWLVGQGADRLVGLRSTAGDEAFVELWNLTDDDEFLRRIGGEE